MEEFASEALEVSAPQVSAEKKKRGRPSGKSTGGKRSARSKAAEIAKEFAEEQHEEVDLDAAVK